MSERSERVALAPAPEPCCLFDSAIGVCGLAWSGRGLTRLQLPERDRAATEQRLRGADRVAWLDAPPVPIAAAIAELRRYFAGEATDFASLALDLEGQSPFNRRVYDAARAIPWGRTTTYGALARDIGQAGAARAVGHALGRNPLAVIVPCHRILGGGKLGGGKLGGGKWIGGFSAFGGAETKQCLLRLEGVGPDDATPLLAGLLPVDARGEGRVNSRRSTT